MSIRKNPRKISFQFLPLRLKRNRYQPKWELKEEKNKGNVHRTISWQEKLEWERMLVCFIVNEVDCQFCLNKGGFGMDWRLGSKRMVQYFEGFKTFCRGFEVVCLAYVSSLCFIYFYNLIVIIMWECEFELWLFSWKRTNNTTEL